MACRSKRGGSSSNLRLVILWLLCLVLLASPWMHWYSYKLRFWPLFQCSGSCLKYSYPSILLYWLLVPLLICPLLSEPLLPSIIRFCFSLSRCPIRWVSRFQTELSSSPLMMLSLSPCHLRTLECLLFLSFAPRGEKIEVLPLIEYWKGGMRELIPELLLFQSQMWGPHRLSMTSYEVPRLIGWCVVPHLNCTEISGPVRLFLY